MSRHYTSQRAELLLSSFYFGGKMNQKTIEGYKREISETSAANFGYYPDVLPAILEKVNGDMIFEIMSDGMGDYLNQLAKHNKSAEFHNVLVTEAVQKMNYQEFWTNVK